MGEGVRDDNEYPSICTQCIIQDVDTMIEPNCSQWCRCMTLWFNDNLMFEQFFMMHHNRIEDLFRISDNRQLMSVLRIYIDRSNLTHITDAYVNSTMNINISRIKVHITFRRLQNSPPLTVNMPFRRLIFNQLVISIACNITNKFTHYTIGWDAQYLKLHVTDDCPKIQYTEQVTTTTTSEVPTITFTTTTIRSTSRKDKITTRALTISSLTTTSRAATTKAQSKFSTTKTTRFTSGRSTTFNTRTSPSSTTTMTTTISSATTNIQTKAEIIMTPSDTSTIFITDSTKQTIKYEQTKTVPTLQSAATLSTATTATLPTTTTATLSTTTTATVSTTMTATLSTTTTETISNSINTHTTTQTRSTTSTSTKQTITYEPTKTVPTLQSAATLSTATTATLPTTTTATLSTTMTATLSTTTTKTIWNSINTHTTTQTRSTTSTKASKKSPNTLLYILFSLFFAILCVILSIVITYIFRCCQTQRDLTDQNSSTSSDATQTDTYSVAITNSTAAMSTIDTQNVPFSPFTTQSMEMQTPNKYYGQVFDDKNF